MPTLTPIVTIECVFGSEYQRDVAMRLLREMLRAWKETAESNHQRNKITITEDEP